MLEFWRHLAPWLIAAVLLPGWIVVALKIMPTEAWAERVIRDWAEAAGFRLAAIEAARWTDRLLGSHLYRIYRLRVVDREGRERRCKAVVGRLLVGRTARNIAITWTKAP